jgi:hypothetical protein
MKHIIAAALATFALVASFAPHADAATPHPRTVKVMNATHKAKHKRLVYVRAEMGGGSDNHADSRVLATFNDGSMYLVRRCAREDSPRCFWDARTSGNRRGRSFVRLSGATYYLDGQVKK